MAGGADPLRNQRAAAARNGWNQNVHGLDLTFKGVQRCF